MTGDLFAYDPTTRLLTGLLVPYGVVSRPSVSGAEPIMFGAGTVTLPRDPSVVTLNRHHDRFDPVGRAVELTETPAGIRAAFAIADTDEGDAYLRDEAGRLRALSAELAGIVRDGVRAVRARLTGAALVTQPALAGAGLFAAAPDPDEDELPDELPADVVGIVNEQGSSSTAGGSDTYNPDPLTDVLVSCATCGAQLAGVAAGELRHADDGGHTFVPDVDPLTDPDPDPDADVNPDADTDTDPEEEDTLMSSIVPGHATTTRPRPTLDGLFAAIARNDPDQLAAYRGAGELFALQPVNHSGPGAVTISDDTAQRDYLGELWGRAPYNRRIVPLLGHATLTSWNMQGWRWVPGKSPEVADYAGNGTEVPSNALDTEPVNVQAARLAGGHRIDRRFSDFNDQAVIESYVVHQTEDYKRKTDGKALAAVIAAAQTTAPGAVPTSVAKGLAAIVDAALGVVETENTPAYALVSPELWRDILLTPKDDVLAYLESGFGLEEGSADGFKLRPAAVGKGNVIVGAREALTFYELGETPIRVEGVVPGNGATDVAVFGYWATLVNNAAAIRKVTVAGTA